MSITDIEHARGLENTHKPLARESGMMNAAQMQALQEAARKLGEDVSLRKWCVEQAIKAVQDEPVDSQASVVALAEQIHRFIVGQ